MIEILICDWSIQVLITSSGIARNFEWGGFEMFRRCLFLFLSLFGGGDRDMACGSCVTRHCRGNNNQFNQLEIISYYNLEPATELNCVSNL